MLTDFECRLVEDICGFYEEQGQVAPCKAVSESSGKEKTHELPDGNIITVSGGATRVKSVGRSRASASTTAGTARAIAAVRAPSLLQGIASLPSAACED